MASPFCQKLFSKKLNTPQYLKTLTNATENYKEIFHQISDPTTVQTDLPFLVFLEMNFQQTAAETPRFTKHKYINVQCYILISHAHHKST